MARKSQAVGKSYEAQVDLSLARYQAQGLADSQINYPEIVVTRFPNARIVGKAGSDRTATLAGQGGRTCHLEIKTWQAKDKHTYSFTGSASNQRRRAQYRRLLRAVKFGAIACYLVCWRYNGSEEWRLYPVEMLVGDQAGLEFIRTEGIYISDDAGYPDWLVGLLLEDVTRGVK